MINDPRYFIEHSIWQIPDAIVDNLWILCLFIITFISYKAIEKKLSFIRGKIYHILFAESIVFIAYHTLYNRHIQDTYEYNFLPFWSYMTNDYRGLNLIIQNIFNVMLYVPFGFFAGSIFKRANFIKVLMLAFTLSIVIELVQLILRCGFCETDDVIHNVVGSIIGYLLFASIKK